MCCITLFFGNWSMLGWFRVLWHSWLPAGKNKNAFKILQKSNSYTIVIFRFHISQNMKVETIWFPSDFCCTMYKQSYEIKSPPWTILWFRSLGIFSVENIDRLGVFMFQTWDNSQLCIDLQYYCLKFETSKHSTYLYLQQGKGPPSKQA